MHTRSPQSMAVNLNVASLVVAAAGVLMQYFSGVEGFPLIPPGPIVLLVAAALVAFGSGPWTSAVGVIAPLFVLIGGTIATVVNWGAGAPLSDPANVVGFVGSVLQFLGVITAFVAGIVAVKQSFGDPS